MVDVGSCVSRNVGRIFVVGRRLGRGIRVGKVEIELSIEGEAVTVGWFVGRWWVGVGELVDGWMDG